MTNLEQFLQMQYRITLHWDGEDWIARNPDLSGCIADGKTILDALESLAISRKLWIESRLACGLEVPVPGKNLLEEKQEAGRFVVRKNDFGFACAIDLDGITVLHLLEGTERNEMCAKLVADGLSSLGEEHISALLHAVKAYRYLKNLKKGK